MTTSTLPRATPHDDTVARVRFLAKPRPSAAAVQRGGLDALAAASTLTRSKGATFLRTFVDDALAGRQRITETRLAIAVLSDSDQRDRIIATISVDNAARHVRMWEQALASVRPVDAAPAWGLLGLAYWLTGRSAELRAVAAILTADYPQYTLGAMLTNISDRNVAPSWWEQTRADIYARLNVDAL